MSAPIRHTCPDIDEVINAIQDAEKTAIDSQSIFDVTELHEALESIESELYHLDGKMEDLRAANDALRTWGEEQEAEKEAFESELNDL